MSANIGKINPSTREQNLVVQFPVSYFSNKDG